MATNNDLIKHSIFTFEEMVDLIENLTNENNEKEDRIDELEDYVAELKDEIEELKENQ